MQRPAKPDNEAERLRALHRSGILDSGSDAAFDDLVSIAAAICGVPMALVSLVDTDRQWFKARLGLADTETSRDVSFCAHAILDPGQTMVIADAREDLRFRDNPLVTDAPGIRFYAGAPLLDLEGLPLGTLCVLDDTPRKLEPFQLKALDALSRQVSSLLELHRVSRELKLQLQDRNWYEDQLTRFSEQLELANADLHEQVRLDALTGLANRRALGAALELALEGDDACCVALLDIDHFKAVNDTHGHAAGDDVLVQVANTMRAASAGHGLLARHGGEEFAWVLPGVGLDQAVLQCEYLREAVKFASAALPVTISIGVASVQPGDIIASLLQRADTALYAAKHAGRDRVMAG
ncbi:GGDEF domain-containing protein [Thermomonas carbonis]|uniref:Sensor domain-containing diguanylate cyclase n=1 Tax=Thermomonas carbonis TaxID=1463158 RepID=A0A7G9STX0_9GAMM|nr:sensor domain-containing diguanylate cyclase [Thermomonas carbonis]QNN71295.1 sensor domain-containing diguanylate cyclase [Thermomonas carbonis]GHC10572.1 GGDEF domain-containing protein [Thermomonas carbonis]